MQPSAPITDFNIVAGAGPAEAAFNEFTPLFARDDAQLTTTGFVGNNDTLGGESVLSMLYGRTSLSVGGLYSDTDGFRDNNDAKSGLANAYGQVAVTPNFNLQAEYRYRNTDQGDLALDFDPLDPATFSLVQRRDIDQNTLRIGLHATDRTNSDIIMSLLSTKREEHVTILPGLIEDDLEDEGVQFEAQYLYLREVWSAVAGGGYYNIDRDQEILRPSVTDRLTSDREQSNLYTYTHVKYPRNFKWIFGLGYDDFEQSPISVQEVSPKAGLLWDITERIRLRAAAMKTVKRALAVDQTIEPTQVAGFNQFFDDLNGTTAKRYGIGFDVRVTDNLYAGVEVSGRELQVPSGEDFEDRTEGNYRGYLYQTLGRDWTITLEAEYDRFESELGNDPDVPRVLGTLSFPLTVRYFHPKGPFSAFRLTMAYQDVEREDLSELPEGSDTAALLDAMIGYRLPNRRGIFSLQVNNMLDRGVKLQDDNFRSSHENTQNTRFFPDRTILARATLAF